MTLQLNNTDMTKTKKGSIVAVMFQENTSVLLKYSVGTLKIVNKGDIEYVENETIDGTKCLEPKITEQMYKRLIDGGMREDVRQMESVMMTKKDLDKYVEDTECKIELLERNTALAYKFYQLKG
jgi:hypothetical protein